MWTPPTQTDCSWCHQSVTDRFPKTEKLIPSLKRSQIRDVVLSRVFACRKCGADISASLRSDRVVCCQCETRLRHAAKRLALIHRCS
jgi:hypothetical protein